ncbi:MAG: penicillin-binding transpeptidase domain-containing protein [Peptococcaceae bacterium]|nr:penicillin-binding transpeptidase domain-containing protein [Peptococcaceae bacterium]
MVVVQKLPAQRGSIYDRHHHILVANKPYYSLYAYPNEITDKKAMAIKLSPLIHQTSTAILQHLERNRYYTDLSNNISYKIMKVLQNMHLGGIYLPKKETSFFPQGRLAAQVLGFTGAGEKGIEGLEAEYNRVLAGRSGWETANIDGLGNILPSTARNYVPPRPGDNLVLTIDESIQFRVQEELRRLKAKFHPTWAAIIVMNPATGGILAIGSTPGFDPSRWARYPEKVWGADPPVLNSIEPGSVFKIVTTSAALEQGIATPATRSSYPGYITVDGIRLHDWNYQKDNNRTLAWAFQNSYNPVFAALALKLGVNAFYRYIRGFGFGRPTGVDLPGEASGIVIPARSVTSLNLATMGFGQSISVTPIQMLTAACAVANGGYLMVPRLVREITDAGGKVVQRLGPRVVRQVVSSVTATRVMQMMRRVVKRGTGIPAAVPGYRVAGKTGTAQVPGPHGYRKGVYVGSFLGFAPYPHPRAGILVVVDHPRGKEYYGDQVAAPAFKAVASYILHHWGIPPSTPGPKTPPAGPVNVTLPDLRGYPEATAGFVLKMKGLKAVASGRAGTVAGQVPSPGARVPYGGAVVLHLARPKPGSPVYLPDLAGLSMKEAGTALVDLGLQFYPVGSGVAGRQYPSYGTMVKHGSMVKVWFSPPPG